jgi:hypothetical protein
MRIQFAILPALLLLCGPFDAAAQSVCVKPWAIADKWIDNHDETAPIDQLWSQDDTFESMDADGNPRLDADVYFPPTDPRYTGFSSAADIGLRVSLKAVDAGAAKPTSFFAVDINGAAASAAAYKTAIATCDPQAPNGVFFGDTLTVLNGNLHGPTIQGVMDLMSQDPNAKWDPVTQTIVESCTSDPTPCAGVSPRLAVIATFDPAEFENSSRLPGPLQVRVANFVGVFIEGYVNGYIVGVIAPVR